MKKKRITFEDQWSIINKNTNWNTIYSVMKTLDWFWNDYGIPSIETIKKEAYRLCEIAFFEKKDIGSGGFNILFDKEDETLSLSFSIVEVYVSEYI